LEKCFKLRLDKIIRFKAQIVNKELWDKEWDYKNFQKIQKIEQNLS